MAASRHWPYMVATAAVSATVLLLEITLTRFFSLFLHYHYVFVALAVALLGLGLGATLCAATKRWWGGQVSRQTPTRLLWQVCIASGVLLMVVTMLLTQTSLASVLPAAATLALLPFLGAGWFLALVFTVEATRSRALYAADLLGAGTGCLISLPALQWLGAEYTLALAALALLAMAALLAVTTDRRRCSVPVSLCLLFGAMVGATMASGLLTIHPMAILHGNKHLSRILDRDPQARIVDTRWSALARTDVVAFSHQGQHQYAAFTDGGAATVLMPLPVTPAEWARLDHNVGLLPYRTPPQERVLIIGAGGGLDVVLALHGGAQDITAVEVNPDILRAVERFMPPARNVYRSPKVRVVRGDGRQVVRRSSQVYDLIVLPQVYTGAAQRQGGTLVENYALTTEAFQDYLAHLTPQGRVMVQVHDVVEVLKTVLMSLEALARSGNTGPAALHYFLIFQEASDAQDTLLPIHAPVMILKKTPYTPAESQRQTTLMQTMQLTPLFVPHIASASPLDRLLQHMMPFFSQSRGPGIIWPPATDNRPFFYETTADMASFTWLPLATLFLLLVLHLWHYVCQRDLHATTPPSTAWLPFFAATGCAALLAQVALLQRYMLVVGSPTLIFVTLLFPLLVFGGVSSLASTALSDRLLQRLLPWTCMALGGLLMMDLVAFPVLRGVLETQDLAVRVVGTMMFLAPLGTCMGLPFPVALHLLSPPARALTPWVWGVNTGACVLGSVTAIHLAVSWGFQAVVLLSALLYILAGCWAHYLLAKASRHGGVEP